MFTASRYFVLAAALMVAAPMAAQQAAFDSTSQGAAVAASAVVAAPVATSPTTGPVFQPAAVVSRSQSATTPLTMMAMPVNGENSHNVALMVVGGAGLIVGAVIGGRSGTIVMVGSGVIGLVGLFRYLQ